MLRALCPTDGELAAAVARMIDGWPDVDAVPSTPTPLVDDDEADARERPPPAWPILLLNLTLAIAPGAPSRTAVAQP